MKLSRQTYLVATAIFLLLLLAGASYYFLSEKNPEEVQTAAAATIPNTPESGEIATDSIAEEEEIPEEEPLDIDPKEVTGAPIKLNDSISVIPKNIEAADCDLDFSWEEIKLKNPKLTAALNKEIKQFAAEALNNCLGSEVPCGQCNMGGSLYYLSPEMMGIALYSSEQIAGRIQHHQHMIYFNPATGKKIIFRELLKPKKAADFDSLVMQKLLQHFDLSSEKFYLKQLQDPNFDIEPGQVNFTLYNEVGNHVMDARLSFAELQPLLNITISDKYLRQFPEAK